MFKKKMRTLCLYSLCLGLLITVQNVSATSNANEISLHYFKRFCGKLSWAAWAPGQILLYGAGSSIFKHWWKNEANMILEQDLLPFIVGALLYEGSYALYEFSKLPKPMIKVPKSQDKAVQVS